LDQARTFTASAAKGAARLAKSRAASRLMDMPGIGHDPSLCKHALAPGDAQHRHTPAGEGKFDKGFQRLPPRQGNARTGR
jgi:hypothetical protein